MQYLRSYTITHLEGDPLIKKNGTLELGNHGCMKKMRPYVYRGDWVIAKLGKRFWKIKGKNREYPFTKSKGHDFDKKKYLFYAMEVTSTRGENEKKILCSKKGSHYCFFKTPLPIKPHFFSLLTNGQSNKKIEFEENDSKLANKFIEWIKRQKPKTSINSKTNNPVQRCRKICY